MGTYSASGSENSYTCVLCNDVADRLYSLLRPRVKKWIYDHVLPSWKGQENEVVEDILQDTLERLIKQEKKIEQGQAAPLTSINAMSRAIALNCCKDKWRKDHRVERFPEDEYKLEVMFSRSNWVDPAEVAIDNVYREWLFLKVSYNIAKFSAKKREALLIDLAGLMDFENTLSPLQKALWEQGIQMREYQGKKPVTPGEKSRYSSLLSLAYKKVRNASEPFLE
jgi:DNA-directed RNA polymerase specialized sigma24 family protein